MAQAGGGFLQRKKPEGLKKIPNPPVSHTLDSPLYKGAFIELGDTALCGILCLYILVQYKKRTEMIDE